MIGDANANYLYGYEGNDGLDGMAGNDRLAGGNGNDSMRGRTGNDRLEGGAGTDAANYDTAAGGVHVNLTSNAASGADGVDVLSLVENVTGSAYADYLTGSAG